MAMPMVAGCDNGSDVRHFVLPGLSRCLRELYKDGNCCLAMGGGWLLPRAIGLSRAMEMSLTGVRVDCGGPAWKLGLISRVPSPMTPLMDHLFARWHNHCRAKRPDASRTVASRDWLRGSRTQSLAGTLAESAEHFRS